MDQMVGERVLVAYEKLVYFDTHHVSYNMMFSHND